MILGSNSGWNKNLATCTTPIAYSILNSDGTTDNSGIFSISGSDIIVNTQLASKIGSYNMKLVGTVTGYDTKETLFTVNVVDGCATMSLTTTLNSSPQTYFVQQVGPMILGDTLWTQSSSVCPAISFIIEDIGLSSTADSTLFSIVGTNV